MLLGEVAFMLRTKKLKKVAADPRTAKRFCSKNPRAHLEYSNSAIPPYLPLDFSRITW
jgi:hypothetical protein